MAFKHISELLKEREMYFDYVNNFLTVEKFAEHYQITIQEAERIITENRT